MDTADFTHGAELTENLYRYVSRVPLRYGYIPYIAESNSSSNHFLLNTNNRNSIEIIATNRLLGFCCAFDGKMLDEQIKHIVKKMGS